MNLIEKQYTDESGIPRLVLIPDNESDVSLGIPISLSLDSLYGHMPLDFQRALVTALHDQGLVKAQDYFAPDAYTKFRAALLSVIRHDFFSVQSLAKESLNGQQ